MKSQVGEFAIKQNKNDFILRNSIGIYIFCDKY